LEQPVFCCFGLGQSYQTETLESLCAYLEAFFSLKAALGARMRFGFFGSCCSYTSSCPRNFGEDQRAAVETLLKIAIWLQLRIVYRKACATKQYSVKSKNVV
jgi:hypothetical protein